MSILSKPYEISLWQDADSGEQKICVIGTDTADNEFRALEPILSRNVNGVKKLSFKMYKKCIDTQTGLEVENPYMQYMVSERKVKLKYENEFYDFIIKNISENSSTHLCTYQLEDAIVQELSKNGFNVVLDPQLRNNMGTAKQLAKTVLSETDWDVSDDTEVFVQTIDEALVYIVFPSSFSKTVYEITDQSEDRLEGVTATRSTLPWGGKKVLAFYSSCTGKPHRFQFIYDSAGYSRDEERYITNKNCQYYIDFDNPERDYTEVINSYGFTLPTGFDVTTTNEDGVNVTISTRYRGRRYGFAQQAEFIPVLNRYVNLYKKGTADYFGYEHAEYKSPALNTNIISNSTFESTSGWIGTKKGGSGEKAKIERVYGYFDGAFINSIDELKNGTFDPENKAYKPYLKIEFNDSNSSVINSGPFDNRTLIGEMIANDEWALRYVCKNAAGETVNNLQFSIGEYIYSSSADGYVPLADDQTEDKVLFDDETRELGDYTIFKVEDSTYTKETFKKKMKVRVQITPPSNISGKTTYYLEEIELFKVAYYNGNIIPLNEQGETLENRVVEKTYYYFQNEALDGITSEDQLKPAETSKVLSYSTYKPVYNTGAEKVRSITAKESNYFNILQSIAETFEAWLVFKITRNSSGGITTKEVLFKNYIAGENHAYFRYGVNLKDIQRTYESKNIVTKLIVKNNSNEHAKNGFCTIQRADANPTGENYIYDFQYFFNQDLLSSSNYLNTLYVIDGACGADYSLWESGVASGSFNLQGYFPRVKRINKELTSKNEILVNTAQDLTKYKANLEVAEAGYEASLSGIEQTREEFELLTGVPIDKISDEHITSVELATERSETEEDAKEDYGYYCNIPSWISSISVVTTYDSSSHKRTIKATANVAEDKTSGTDRSIYIKAYPRILVAGGAILEPSYSIKCTVLAGQSTGEGEEEIHLVNIERNDVQKKLQEYATYCGNELRFTNDKNSAESNVERVENEYNSLKNIITRYGNWKKALNQLFFETYSRFIQEGTWINEEYVDDEKYYADAQSVMYNSCYPQVAYSINVIELSKLPGYEDFTYKLGETTYVEDPEFFGEKCREQVVISELVENLDDPSKNQIKVQNFKNQFQDLFQKITATVQQAQYSTGAYQKAVALAEANQERKQAFLTEALDSASARLTAAGQQSVTWGNDGITVKSVSSPCDAIRMVGGAILLSKQDERGEQKWVTGVTSDGVSASLITAGIINAGEISIMNYNEPVFRWDEFGISAYDANWYDSEFGSTISGVNSRKFVRFDKHGLYGINNNGVDGAAWHPENIEEINNKATFSLTWEGLKVVNDSGIVLRIGDNAKTSVNNTNLLDVSNRNGESILAIKEDGSLLWGQGSSPTKTLYARTKLTKPAYKYSVYLEDSTYDWHTIQSDTDWYISYSYDGGNTWGNAIQIQAASSEETIEYYYANNSSIDVPKRPNDAEYVTGEWAEKWKTSITETGYDEDQRYLWNYTETKLTNGTSLYTYPVLISTSGKAILKLYEFYALSESGANQPQKPQDFTWDEENEDLAYTDTDSVWEKIDTSEETNMSSKVAGQSQTLWNFEVIVYTDKQLEIGRVKNIASGGRGINYVENYYLATNTEEMPSESAEGWILNEFPTDHGPSKPYLWNYEITYYSDGTPVPSKIKLLTSEPRVIKEIVELFKTTNTTSMPAYPALDDDGNGITVSGDKKNTLNDIINIWTTDDRYEWSKDDISVSNGETLWNAELIEFQAVDGDGCNLFKLVGPIKTAYVGIDKYSLSLDNDNDTIVIDNSGELVSTLPTITASCYIGHEQQDLQSGEIEVFPPDTSWIKDKHYELARVKTGSFGVYVFRILELPNTSFTSANFRFEWRNTKSGGTFDTDTLSIKTLVSTVDYDLMIPQTTYNSSMEGGEIEIQVFKKSLSGSDTLDSAGEENIKLYQKKNNKYKVLDDWTVGFARYNIDPIHFVLTSNDGAAGTADANGYFTFTTNPSIFWDEEVIEFTQNGSNSVCVAPTPSITKTYEEWKLYGKNGTQPKNEIITISSVAGLKNGDFVYFTGIVSDKYSSNTDKMTVTIDGKIVDIDSDQLQLTIEVTAVVFGPEKGEKGEVGAVTYESMWDAFKSAQSDSNGIVAFYDKNDPNKKLLGFRGDMIQTGYIRVADPNLPLDADEPWKNATFYAGFGNNIVTLGGMTVGDLVNNSVGRNYILNSASLSYDGITGQDPNDTSSASGGPEYAKFNVGRGYSNLPEGEIVTVSFDLEMKINKVSFKDPFSGDKTCPYLMVYNTNDPGPAQIDSRTIEFLNTDVGDTIVGRYSVTTTIIRNSDEDADNFIEFYSSYGSNNYFRISNLKLEKGETATEWSAAPEDNLQANISNNFSWQFSPTNGIRMWNGTQTAGQEVFKIWKNTSTNKHELILNGSGTFTGTITATGGNIGGCSISGGVLQVGSSSITNGAITADKIATGAITAGKIAAGAITADKIAAGAITADKISAGTITADKISAGTITASKIKNLNNLTGTGMTITTSQDGSETTLGSGYLNFKGRKTMYSSLVNCASIRALTANSTTNVTPGLLITTPCLGIGHKYGTSYEVAYTGWINLWNLDATAYPKGGSKSDTLDDIQIKVVNGLIVKVEKYNKGTYGQGW